jgi:hypothetical protein
MRLDACCGFAKFRSSYPPEMQSDYLDYLRNLTAHIFEDTDEYFPIVLSDEEYLFDTAFDTPELLSLLCSERLLGDAASSAFLQEAQLRDDLSACALLLDYRCTLNNADKLHLDSL